MTRSLVFVFALALIGVGLGFAAPPAQAGACVLDTGVCVGPGCDPSTGDCYPCDPPPGKPWACWT